MLGPYSIQGWTNFSLGTRLFGYAKKGGQNQIVRPIEAQLKILLFLLYYLNRIFIAAFILNVFPSKVFAM